MKLPLFCLFLTIFFISGCVDKTVKKSNDEALNVPAPYAPGAITLNIQATPKLNAWKKVANSCSTLIIQSEKIEALTELLSDSSRLENLFQGLGTEESVLKVDRYVALPGQRTTLHIDRSANTRFIAVVAGYYPFPTSQHIKTIRVPHEISQSGWFRKRTVAKLLNLRMDIILGDQGIVHFEHQDNTDDANSAGTKAKMNAAMEFLKDPEIKNMLLEER